MIVGHGVICENRESEGNSHDPLGEDAKCGLLLGLLRPLAIRRTSIALLDGSVVLVPKVDGRPLNSIGGFNKGSLLGDEGIVGQKDMRLHIRVGFLKEEVAKENADKEQRSANEIGEKVGVDLAQRTLGKQVREGVVRVGKSASNCWTYDCPNRPDEGHCWERDVELAILVIGAS